MSVEKLTAEAWQLWALAVAAKACLVLACAVLATRLMRERAAAERHLVWVVAVAAVLALPVLTLLVPVYRVAVPDWLRWSSSDTGAAATVTPAVIAAPSAPRAPSARTIAPVPPVPPAIAPPTPLQPQVAPAAPERRSASELLVLAWLAGVLAVAGGIVSGFVRVRGYVRRARPVRDRVLLVRAHGIAAELGISRRLRLLEGAADVMPMTFGIVRPALLLPSSARAWTKVRQETVLRHELAHIRRRDSLAQLAAELACALYWFNPLVWLAARRLYIEREHACDDLVLASGSRAADYAAELLDIARLTRLRRAVPLAAIAMARPSQLRLRIAALLEERPRRAMVSGRLLVPTWAGVVVFLLPLSSLAPSLRTRASVSPVPQVPAATEPVRTSAAAQRSALTDARGFAHSAAGPSSITLAPAAPVEALLSAGPAVAAVVQEDCLRRARNRTMNHNTGDRRTTMKWSGDDCSGEVEIEGEVQFDPDFTTITGLSRGGSFRLVIGEGRDERRVLIRPGDGGLSYDYSVNGSRTEFDAAGQRWLSSTLLFLFRNLGLMAEERATAILERRGADALLTETGMLAGDYARAKYLKVLVDRGRLDERSLRRVLELAGNTIGSDHYRAEVITAVAGRYDFTDAVRQAYIDAASHMSSDHYRHQAFATVLSRGNLTPTQISAVLREARRISSDHYRAELLRTMRNGYSMTPAIREAYLDAAAGMSSDHYRAAVLGGLLEEDLVSTEIARVVEASSSISSDHYRADLLSKLAGQNLREPVVQVAFVRSASGISSDHYKHQVLQQAASRADLDRGALLGILDAAATIDSDHYLSVLLIHIAQRHRLAGDARERFLKAMDRIGSSHYRGNVASALLRQERS